MRITIFGGSGMIGRRVVQEALRRGHEVTAVARNPEKIDITHAKLTVEKGDAMNRDDIARFAAGSDCIVSAVKSAPNGTDAAEVASNFIAVLSPAGIKRLIVVAGAGLLEVAPGKRHIDSPDFNPHAKAGSLRHFEALKRLQASGLDFGVFSPAQTIAPGERTGKFRTGVGRLLRDESGKSFVSAEDYAVAMLDEIENPKFLRQNFTVAN